ncbi:MAG: hypothetical protein VR72_13995 [Clostridiaceae bacterium BRH_c20a]|nr:MAG: hypothetical protein VR72_13995 [Clostridiaceae bacterium BRH_c20a]
MLPIKKLNLIKQEWTKAGALGLSMRLRLFLFLVVLMVTMILGVIVILLLTGTFTAGLNESKKLFKNELIHISEDVSKQYGQLSVQAVELSRNLSISIEKKLNQKGLDVTDLQSHPEMLEDLLAGEYEQALFSLQKSKSSGVFMILNATKNAKLVNSENSRAGLFIKNMEPNILSSSSPTILLLRGFPNIGRKNLMPLHAQWSMEFDISDAPYYQLPMELADKQTLPLSRLYYWSPAITLPGTSEEVMLCSVPLIDSLGNVFGVCGFEVSAMLFKLAHMPDNSTYTRIFCMFAPISKNVFDTSNALFSGGYSTRKNILNNQLLHITEGRKSFSSYKEENGNSFVGFHVPVKLYPEGSAFFDQKWAAAVMIPAEDISDAVISFNLRLALMFTLLTILGILISFFLSRQYIKPITLGLDIIKSNNLNEGAKTKILEIDQLIEFLFLKNEELLKKGDEEQDSRVFNEFLKNIKNLSPAERSVFNLYVQQFTAKEIAGILCLSINTIKTHNKRIYTKLKVTSREELLLYINMLKEAGKDFK